MSRELGRDQVRLKDKLTAALESLQHLLLINPADVAAALDDDDIRLTRRLLRDMQVWSDRFEAAIGEVPHDAHSRAPTGSGGAIDQETA